MSKTDEEYAELLRRSPDGLYVGIEQAAKLVDQLANNEAIFVYRNILRDAANQIRELLPYGPEQQ